MSTASTPGLPSHSYGTEVIPVLRDRELNEVPIARHPFAVHVNARDMNVTGKPILTHSL